MSKEVDLTSVMERMRIHEAEIARYDGLIADMGKELKDLKEARQEQIDSLRSLARNTPLPLLEAAE